MRIGIMQWWNMEWWNGINNHFLHFAQIPIDANEASTANEKKNIVCDAKAVRVLTANWINRLHVYGYEWHYISIFLPVSCRVGGLRMCWYFFSLVSMLCSVHGADVYDVLSVVDWATNKHSLCTRSKRFGRNCENSPHPFWLQGVCGGAFEHIENMVSAANDVSRDPNTQNYRFLSFYKLHTKYGFNVLQ